MLVIHIELWPGGDGSRRRKLGQINIGNDGTGTEAIGNYIVAASHTGEHFEKKSGPYKVGQVVGFPRKLSPYRLLARALKAIRET